MSKNRYQVSGEYTISFDAEIIAESEDEAIQIAEDLYFWESANGGIFVDEDGTESISLNADGMIDNVVAECLEEDIEDEEEDEEDE